MTYKIVPVDNLMAYEFVQTEADFHYLSESELSSVLKEGQSVEQLKETLRDGHFVLLTENPSIPLLVNEKDKLGVKAWRISKGASGHLTPVAQRAILSRTKMSGQSAPASGRLPPPLPMPPYVPEPVVKDPALPFNYEYCVDMACSDASFRSHARCQFYLGKTKTEEVLGQWQNTVIAPGVTRYKTVGQYSEPKKLIFQIVDSPLGLTSSTPVTMRTLGANVATEGFIPVMPVVQIGMRLGVPTEGFFYHFHKTVLVQEYHIVRERNGFFFGTMSGGTQLNAEHRYHLDVDSILVYWKWGGKVVEDQYLVYLDRQMTADELSAMDDTWLQTHGVKLDIPALLEVTHEPILAREETEKPTVQVVPLYRVAIDPETGVRESWMNIAEQYGLTARQLLDLNSQFDFAQKEPGDLKVGDELCVDPEQLNPKKREAPKVFGYPPQPPSLYNAPLNSYYEYSESFIDYSTVMGLRKNRVTSDIPVVRVKDVTPYKVFAKSCLQPEGGIDAGQDEDRILFLKEVKMEKIAVFGSAFNPPSLGHKSVIDSLNHFNRVLLVPSISHAWGKEMLDFDTRCQLIEAFISDIDSDKVALSKIEQELVIPGESVTTYAVLTKVEEIFPHADITFVIGPDNLLNFDKFYKSSEILQRWSIMACPERIPVRSTEIRRRLSENDDISGLTTPNVKKLLHQMKAY